MMATVGQNINNDPEAVPEFLSEEQVSPHYLGLQDEEPDTWASNVSQEILKTLNEKEIKRQEHIYEFVQTEKHHCLMLILMQKIFVNGAEKFLGTMNVHRMFPRLAELTEIHLKFLQDLRQRQRRDTPAVETISDILLDQFSSDAADKLKDVYGEFCSQHRDSVDIYKSYLAENAEFSAFVKRCQNNPLLKKKGIPECILFVTQRLTKYPLLIEPLIKTSKENENETVQLSKALALVRNILTEVNSRIAEKENEMRKAEIHEKIDPKSWTTYRGNRFERSDIITPGRKLIFEGQAQLLRSRRKLQLVHVIVLSDVLFFLVENCNNKFAFYTPDHTAGIISLQKLLVRERAGNDGRHIFLVSSDPQTQTFKLKILKPKNGIVWFKSIRSAVENCLEDNQLVGDRIAKEPCLDGRVGHLQQKDVELALVCEEKIASLLKSLSATGLKVDIESPSYRQFVAQFLDSDTLRREVSNTIRKVHKITSASHTCGRNLSRSVSSVGELRSDVYVSPVLPKRAETFSSFDNAVFFRGSNAAVSCRWANHFHKKSRTNLREDANSPSMGPISSPSTTNRKLFQTPVEIPSITTIMQMDSKQQLTVVLLTNHMYKLASIVAQQMSTIKSLEAQILITGQELHPNEEKERKPVYKLNQQLEELRNMQDKFTQEKQQFQRERDAEGKELEEIRQQLHKLQEQVCMAQEDVIEQREQLHRKLEAVSSQGLVNAANPPLLMSPQLTGASTSKPQQIDSSGCGSFASTSLPIPSSTSSPVNIWKRHNGSFHWNRSPGTTSGVLPPNLISATNEQKGATNVQIEQKLPLRLAMKPEKSSSNEGSGCATGANSTSPVAGISTTSAALCCCSSNSPPNSRQESQ